MSGDSVSLLRYTTSSFMLLLCTSNLERHPACSKILFQQLMLFPGVRRKGRSAKTRDSHDWGSPKYTMERRHELKQMQILSYLERTEIVDPENLYDAAVIDTGDDEHHRDAFDIHLVPTYFHCPDRACLISIELSRS